MPIDSLRGFAVLLMVAGHVIGSSAERGMGVPTDSLWRYSYIGLEDVRMPLFAVLSGYVYAYRPVINTASLKRLIRGKAIRLLLPLLTVGTLFFLTQLLVPGTNTTPEPSDIWKMFVFGSEHLWFVQAMFIMFATIAGLDALKMLRSISRWLFALSLSSLLFVFVTIPNDYDFFSLNGAIRLLPFFLLGYGIHRFAHVIAQRTTLTICFILFIPAYAIRIQTILDSDVDANAPLRILALTCGIFAVTVLMLLRNRIQIRSMAWIGQYSFSIYLLHVFGSAGIRIILNRTGLESDVLLFIVSMVAAIGLPILFERTLGRIGWISWTMLGQRPQRSSRLDSQR